MPALSPLRVASGGRYFETFDGDPFLFLGFNDSIEWPGLEGLYRRRDLDSVDRYLAEVAASGTTVLRLMLEYAQSDGRYFENPAGRFNPVMVRLWDDLFARCETHGLRVLLAPWDNFWMARRWAHHPYNKINGGPAEAPGSFFTDEAVIGATIRRLEFVVERWGGSGALGAWDLFNEIHPYWGGTPTEQAAALARLSDAISETEQRVWGFTRPQTVSVFGPAPAPPYEDLVFRHPRLHFATTHIYEGAIDLPEDTAQPAVTMARWVRYALDKTPQNRPYLDTEHGPIHLFNDRKEYLPEPFDDEYERHLMWAHLMTGGAGSGMRWPARHPHRMTGGMLGALRRLSLFTRLLDWRAFRPQPLNAFLRGEGAEPVLLFGCQSREQALIWLLRPGPPGHTGPLPEGRPALGGLRLALHGMSGGNYRIQPWNTRSEDTLPCLPACASGDNGTLLFPVPPFTNDLAIAIRRSTAEELRA